MSETCPVGYFTLRLEYSESCVVTLQLPFLFCKANKLTQDVCNSPLEIEPEVLI